MFNLRLIMSAVGESHVRGSDQSPITGSLTGSSPLERVTRALFNEILEFTPDSALMTRSVSRALGRNTDSFLQGSMGKIVSDCSDADSTLHDLIIRNFSSIHSRFESRPAFTAIRFHMSIPASIRSLGVCLTDCPNSILSSQKIHQFNHRIEDDNLQKIWNKVRGQIQAARHATPALPEPAAPLQEIRTWMYAHQTALQEVELLVLRELRLTCVPKEVGLFSGLQALLLHNNQLVSFPERLCQGLPALRSLSLQNNRLSSLPEGLFYGMTALKALSLTDNQLATLPERLFRGLPALWQLSLNNNQLVTLPEGLFQELPALQMLYLANNQLFSLPEGLFHRVPPLHSLALTGNRLTSIPEGLFQGITPPLTLSIGFNPLLISWNPLPLFQTGAAFQEEMRAFFNYPCRSPFARFYQLAAGGSSTETLREAFSGLPIFIKNGIFGMVWEEAGRPEGDSQWGEHHAFDDMQIFKRVLNKCVKETFTWLSTAEKNAVYGHVYHLARSENGADNLDFNVYNWGEIHAFDNILRLIDAMCALDTRNFF